MRRACVVSGLFVVLLGACGSGDGSACDLSETVTISGVGFEFGNNSTPLPGAIVSVAECPEISATTDADGFYSLEVPDHSQVTLFVDYPGFPIMYLETLTTDGEDFEDYKLQMVSNAIYTLFAGVLDITPDPARCQIATTVNVAAIRGTTLAEHSGYGAHGIAGATASSTPMIDPQSGPVYFDDRTRPDRDLTETTIDGGIVWANVEPGVYTVSATHPDRSIRSFVATCEAGRFINAGPPWGLSEIPQ